MFPRLLRQAYCWQHELKLRCESPSYASTYSVEAVMHPFGYCHLQRILLSLATSAFLLHACISHQSLPTCRGRFTRAGEGGLPLLPLALARERERDIDICN